MWVVGCREIDVRESSEADGGGSSRSSEGRAIEGCRRVERRRRVDRARSSRIERCHGSSERRDVKGRGWERDRGGGCLRLRENGLGLGFLLSFGLFFFAIL